MQLHFYDTLADDLASLLDALQPQALFQYLDLQFRISQRQELFAHRGKQRLGQFALQLFEKFVEGRLGKARAHDNLLNNMTITMPQVAECVDGCCWASEG